MNTKWKVTMPNTTFVVVDEKFNHFIAECSDVDSAKLIAAAPELEQSLCDLLEWAKGNRGRKDINPYGVPEVKQALKTLAKIQGISDYLDAQTRGLITA